MLGARQAWPDVRLCAAALEPGAVRGGSPALDVCSFGSQNRTIQADLENLNKRFRKN
jgi:hypothetical protein